MSEFKLGSINNIAHFFHENLFYAINAYLEDNSTRWILHNKLTEWELKSTLLCANYLGIQVEYADLPGYRSGLNYDIKRCHRFNQIMDIVRSACQAAFPDCTYDPNYKVLYFREDATRRKMERCPGHLNTHFHQIITNMDALSFEEQVRIFMKCSHFVTIEGAAITNIVFMNPLSRVLVISTTDNSWPLMFGTSRCVRSLDRMILGYPDFNANICYNSDIENTILRFLRT